VDGVHARVDIAATLLALVTLAVLAIFVIWSSRAHARRMARPNQSGS
jgi:hypothetical protein